MLSFFSGGLRHSGESDCVFQRLRSIDAYCKGGCVARASRASLRYLFLDKLKLNALSDSRSPVDLCLLGDVLQTLIT